MCLGHLVLLAHPESLAHWAHLETLPRLELLLAESRGRLSEC